ncbi:MAG: hypothetical protein ACE5FI_17450, partial [Anaerolineales bacterium]
EVLLPEARARFGNNIAELEDEFRNLLLAGQNEEAGKLMRDNPQIQQFRDYMSAARKQYNAARRGRGATNPTGGTTRRPNYGTLPYSSFTHFMSAALQQQVEQAFLNNSPLPDSARAEMEQVINLMGIGNQVKTPEDLMNVMSGPFFASRGQQ